MFSACVKTEGEGKKGGWGISCSDTSCPGDRQVLSGGEGGGGKSCPGPIRGKATGHLVT